MIRQLAQLRPSSTSAEVLFNPTENKPYTIHNIIVTNTTSSAVLASIYHDEDGTTYDATTSILEAVPLIANQTLHYEGKIYGYKSAGNVAVKSSIADAITFTAYGEITGERL
jgi:hypothetical protein